jgi:uncharacterized membrane protein
MESNQPGPDAGISALFDFGFKRFITLSVIKVLYILGMVLIGLMVLAFVVTGFTQGTAAGIGALVVAPIIALLYLIFYRVWLELIVVIFRIGENTSKMVERGQAGPPGGQA